MSASKKRAVSVSVDDSILFLDIENISEMINKIQEMFKCAAIVEDMNRLKEQRDSHIDIEKLIDFITIILGLIDSLHDFYNVKNIDDINMLSKKKEFYQFSPKNSKLGKRVEFCI